MNTATQEEKEERQVNLQSKMVTWLQSQHDLGKAK